jgi:hypothetical protein
VRASAPEDVSAILHRIRAALAAVSAEDIRMGPGELVFYGGFLRGVSSWNPLVAVRRGTVAVSQQGEWIEVRYSFDHLTVCVFATALAAVASELASGTNGVLVFVLVWLWLGGTNIGLGWARTRELIRRAAMGRE